VRYELDANIGGQRVPDTLDLAGSDHRHRPRILPTCPSSESHADSAATAKPAAAKVVDQRTNFVALGAIGTVWTLAVVRRVIRQAGVPGRARLVSSPVAVLRVRRGSFTQVQ
jgi:hypothetical protein